MKKLKKFVLNSDRRLSREEMASVHGADIIAVDECTSEGQTCVYSVCDDNTVTLGVCKRKTDVWDGKILQSFYCKKN